MWAAKLLGDYRGIMQVDGYGGYDRFGKADRPGHRAELAAPLGSGDPVFCVQRADPPDHLYHERNRGVELEAAPRCSHARSLPR